MPLLLVAVTDFGRCWSIFSRPEKSQINGEDERNVLAMLVKGMDIKPQISCELNVHLKTIYSVRYHVLTKLGCKEQFWIIKYCPSLKPLYWHNK